MKPILIVRLPANTSDRHFSHACAQFKSMDELKDNYHIIIVIGAQNIETEFQGLYPKDFDEVEFEKLKERLKTGISLKFISPSELTGSDLTLKE